MKKQNQDFPDAALLRQKAEEQLKKNKVKASMVSSETDMLKLIHELEVHQIELELQNEELILANQRAIEATEKYEELYDFAPSGYFTLSRQGGILEMNLRSAQMLGKERSLLINSRLDIFINKKSRGVFTNFLEEIFQEKSSVICDVPFICKDNNSLHVHLTGIVSENREQCLVTAIDISERKKAENDLRKNLAKYKVLIDTFPIAITISDPEGKIIETNAKALELLGLQREEHLKRKLQGEEWKIIKTDGTIFPQDEYASVKALKENRLVENVEMGIVKSGGEITWLNVTAAPIPIEDFGVLIAYNDITRRRQMESSLLENEERLRLALKATNDVVWDWDIVNDSQQWNEAGKEVFGWTEIVENTVNAAWWGERIHPNDRKRVEDGFNAAVQNSSDSRWQDEYRFRKSDGTYAEVLDRGYILRDNAGKPQRMIGAMLDITERRKAEKLIKENEHKFRTVADFTYDMEYWQLPDGRLNYISPSCERITGYSKHEFISNPDLLVKIVHPDDLVTFMNHNNLENASKSGSPEKEINFRIIKLDSSIVWIEHVCRAVFDDDNNYLGSRVSNRDITERKNAQLALIESEHFAKTIANSTPALLYLYDFEKEKNVWTNDAHKHFFEKINEDASKLQFTDIIQLIHPDDIHAIVADQNELTDSGSISRFNTEIRIKYKGSWKWLRHFVTVFKINCDGKPIQILGALFDIDDQKKTEQDLLEAKEKAEESDRLKTAFLANMSHEIRTPMNGILGFADLLKAPKLSGEQQSKYISIIEKSGARMLNIINQIVDISKIEAGQMELDIRKADINEQIGDIYNFFRPEAEAKMLQLSFRNALPKEKANIETDIEKLYAILANLVKNALKYTHKGSIEFGYNIVESQCIASLQFYVKDTGIGIPKDRQVAIFERFIQADISDQMAYQGAGLGLSISKAYVEMLGGKIWVESEEGIGSKFYFTLPYNALSEEKIVTKKIGQSQDKENQINPEVLGLKILIAEDDETSEMLITIDLEKFSRNVLKARTGNEVVEVSRNNPDIDIILMDILMPGMNGYEATRQIRQFNKDVVIIAQTAFGLVGDRDKAIDAGCNDYISKPINKVKLLSIIHKYFNK